MKHIMYMVEKHYCDNNKQGNNWYVREKVLAYFMLQYEDVIRKKKVKPQGFLAEFLFFIMRM